MGISYSSKKCPSCGSTKFNYIKESKLWECAYCGNMIERHEEIDSLFTIKNVVRQVLIDVSYQRFSEAKANLVECEKIDAKYVGTIIAKICYLLNAALFDNVSPQEQRNMFAQLKKFYSILCEFGIEPTEEEIALYEFLDSAEAYGTLILAYDTLNNPQRIEPLYNFFNPDEVYSLTLNSNLLKYMISHGKYEIADKIVSNYDNIEKVSSLRVLLSEYPDGEQKTKNCTLLISQDILDVNERDVIENYIESSEDSLQTKYAISCAALTTKASPSIRCVMNSIITKIESQDDIKNIFDIIMSKKLVDSEVYTIIEYALEKCNQEVILYIVTLFRNTAQFVVFNHQHFILLLENENVSDDYKKKIIDTAIEFNVSDKSKEFFVSYYLNNITADFEHRSSFIDYLFTLVNSISTSSAEKYIINCKIDGENKPNVVERIFNLDLNISFFRETLDKYVVHNTDSKSVCERIIDVLSEHGLRISENALINVLINSSVSEELKLTLLNRMKNNNLKYLGLLDKYLQSVDVNRFSGYIFQELIDYSETVSYESAVKYILFITDTQTSKAVNSKKLVEKCKISVLNQGYKITHLNTAVECSVLQAYVLASPDSSDITVSVLRSLNARDYRINSDIFVSGIKKKFKKYLAGVKSSLSQSTVLAAQELGLL